MSSSRAVDAGSGRKRLGVVAVTLLLLLLGRFSVKRTTGSSISREGVVNAARCRVRCLVELFKSADDELFKSLSKCLGNPQCTACLKPCSQPFISLALCQRTCEPNEPDDTCQRSCQYLLEIHGNRPGTCPAISSAAVANLGDQSGAVCADAKPCARDPDCDEDLKCCRAECGSVCKNPDDLYYGMPRFPEHLTIREKSKGSLIELKWSHETEGNSALDTVIYIVDTRWNVGKEADEESMTPWQQIMQTTFQNHRLRDVVPGHWYQYRVWAVNMHGSRGPSAPTEPYSLGREPQPPGPPQNLTEGETELMSGKISVTIHWLPPQKTDLPIIRYKVFWSKHLTITDDDETVEAFSEKTSGDQLKLKLPDLESDTTYFIQLQAISQYGESRLKSERASLYINTFALPYAAERVIPTSLLAAQLYQAPPPLHSLVAHHPFFEEGSLKANISWSTSEVSGPAVDRVVVTWSPEVCIADSVADGGLAKAFSNTTQGSYYVVHALRFACRYLVKVQPLSTNVAAGPISNISFHTPSCTEALVKGTVPPECPTNVPSSPGEPLNFQHTFIISNSNITARLSWDAPLSHNSVVSYRLKWGKTIAGHPTLMDQQSALTKVLAKSEVTFSLKNLHESTTYIVQLEALSRSNSAGKMVALEFTTPKLQGTPMGTLYSHVHVVGDSSHQGGAQQHHVIELLPPKPASSAQTKTLYVDDDNEWEALINGYTNSAHSSFRVTMTSSFVFNLTFLLVLRTILFQTDFVRILDFFWWGS